MYWPTDGAQCFEQFPVTQKKLQLKQGQTQFVIYLN